LLGIDFSTMKTKKKPKIPRNPYVLPARKRNGAGSHKPKKPITKKQDIKERLDDT